MVAFLRRVNEYQWMAIVTASGCDFIYSLPVPSDDSFLPLWRMPKIFVEFQSKGATGSPTTATLPPQPANNTFDAPPTRDQWKELRRISLSNLIIWPIKYSLLMPFCGEMVQQSNHSVASPLSFSRHRRQYCIEDCPPPPPGTDMKRL